jgi:hypothetical protein
MVPEAYLKLQDKRISEIIQAQNKLTPISDAQVGLPELGRWIKYNFVETHEKTEILAKLFLPSGGAFGKPMSFPFGTPPGITLNHYGKGKVIYLASPIEEYYERRRLPETRKLIRKLVNILTDNDFVFESGASPGLIMNISGNSGVFYLHLLNYNGAMHEDGYAVECVTPLKNIKIRLGKMFSNTIEIKTLWTNKKIDFKEKDTIIEFCLPELETFETLIIRRN